MEINKVYQGNCKDLLKEIPNNFIDLTVTSPPYDNLRVYDGCEWNIDIFKEVSKELYRVTKDGGVIVWVVGDATINGSETGTSFRQALYFMQCGFNLHDTMIYEKDTQPCHDPRNKRYKQYFEYMFILSKGYPKTYNEIQDIKTKNANKIIKKATKRKPDGSMRNFTEEGRIIKVKENMARSNIWKYNTDKRNLQHPAIFPEKLVYDHIISWSNERDVILDPFAGSGTTLKIAKLLKRNYLGFEISEKYVSLINKRKEQEPLLDHFEVTQALATQESLNKDLTDFQKENPKCPSDTSLNPDIIGN
jgi:DNA modification methylase